jgi:hypothetical protein
MEDVARLLICSSHRDAEWKDRLMDHLRVIQRSPDVEILGGDSSKPGEDPDRGLLGEAERATLCLVLVSPHLLASEFIVDQVLPKLLARALHGDLVVWLVHLQASLWTEVAGLAALQSMNPPSKPLDGLSAEQRAATLASIAQRVGELVRAQAGVGSLASPPPGLPRAGARPPIFVSHADEDGDFAEMMAMKMKEAGYLAWIDVDRLKPGVDWQESIDDAIRHAPALIVVMSPAARASEYVTYEWSFAAGCGVHIIPIMLRETSLHPRLAHLQFLDFTKRIARPWPKLFDQLRAVALPARTSA